MKHERANQPHLSLRMLELGRGIEATEPGFLGRLLPGARARQMRQIAEVVAGSQVPEAREALKALENGHIGSFAQLRVVALVLAQLGDQTRYEAALRSYDPALAFSPPGPRAFAGRGGGISTLPVLRRLGEGPETCFEKIYELGGRGHRNLGFALGTVLAAHPVVAFPRLVGERRGQRLVATLSEWRPARGRGDLATGFDIARRLAGIPVGTIPGAAQHAQPYWFSRNRERLAARIGPALPGFDLALAWAEKQPRIFSHGDLSGHNYDPAGLVWDWDSAGLRAYGYDAAYCARWAEIRDTDELLALSAREVERPGSAAADRLAFATFALALMPTGPLWQRPGLAEDLARRLPELLQATP